MGLVPTAHLWYTGRKMGQITYFVPGARGVDEGILARWRWPIPPAVAGEYVQADTERGDTVIVPYCQGPAVIWETIARGRKVLALHFDPALVLVVQAALTRLPAREVNAAVARLANAPKQQIPLQRYLEGLYTTTCPACLRPAVADFFIWDREQDAPVSKQVRCAACAWDGRTAVDAEDRDRLAHIPQRAMHYHYILDRIAPEPSGDPLRSRLEQLLKLYTHRNLYALAELTLKIENLFSEDPLRRALQALLLDCLDRCSSLAPLPESIGQRRGLALPARFLERNVWRTFEQAIGRLQPEVAHPTPRLADTAGAFAASAQSWDGFVGQGLVRDLPRGLSPRSIRLILLSPPPLDSAAWSLSYLWGAWLLGAEAVAAVRPLVRQRTPDPAWYARVMSGSLRVLAGLLRDEGRLVIVLSGQRPAMVQALMLAASSARLGVASLLQCGDDYRLDFTPTLPQPVSPGRAPLPALVRQATVQAAVETIRARGEPVAWPALHAAIQWRLAERNLLGRAADESTEGLSALDLVTETIQVGLDDPALVRLPGREASEGWWWLAKPGEMAPPLSDRVETAAYDLLQAESLPPETQLTRALYTRFPGILTPDAELVNICLRVYSDETATGHRQLRPEDRPAARQAEREAMVQHLLTLGLRLGYRAAPSQPFDVTWSQENRIAAVFVVRWQAAVSEAAALSSRVAGARPYLVIPGGRAELVMYKLAHNPLWQQALDRTGWQFLKYRHLRQLAAQPEVDQYGLQTIVGLDPIVERQSAQLSLF
jgi:hypothetical protein